MKNSTWTQKRGPAQAAVDRAPGHLSLRSRKNQNWMAFRAQYIMLCATPCTAGHAALRDALGKAEIGDDRLSKSRGVRHLSQPLLLVGLLSACLGVSTESGAQSRVTGADLVGSVVDTAGGYLPGATVTVTTAATNITQLAVTDGTGRFVVPASASRSSRRRAPVEDASGRGTYGRFVQTLAPRQMQLATRLRF